MNHKLPTLNELPKPQGPSPEVQAALDAVEALAMSVLKGDRPDKFAVVERVCKIGQTLRAAVGTRVADFKGVGNPNINVYNQPYGAEGDYDYADNAVVAGGGDQVRMMRETTMGLGPALQAQAVKQETDELETLMRMERILPKKTPKSQRDTIKARIEVILGNMKDRNAEAVRLEARPVVPGVNGVHIRACQVGDVG
jgi:hypothetical protein